MFRDYNSWNLSLYACKANRPSNKSTLLGRHAVGIPQKRSPKKARSRIRRILSAWIPSQRSSAFSAQPALWWMALIGSLKAGSWLVRNDIIVTEIAMTSMTSPCYFEQPVWENLVYAVGFWPPYTLWHLFSWQLQPSKWKTSTSHDWTCGFSAPPTILTVSISAQLLAIRWHFWTTTNLSELRSGVSEASRSSAWRAVHGRMYERCCAWRSLVKHGPV